MVQLGRQHNRGSPNSGAHVCARLRARTECRESGTQSGAHRVVHNRVVHTEWCTQSGTRPTHEPSKRAQQTLDSKRAKPAAPAHTSICHLE